VQSIFPAVSLCKVHKTAKSITLIIDTLTYIYYYNIINETKQAKIETKNSMKENERN